MFCKLSIVFIILMTTVSLPALSAPLPDKDPEIEFDDDDDEKKTDKTEPEKKDKKTEDNTEIDSDASDGDDDEKDDIEMAADNVGKVKQVNDKETPISATSMDSNYITPKQKTSYFSMEFMFGPKFGLLGLSGSSGVGADISPTFRMGKHFSFGVNILFGALFNSNGDFLQTLGIQLDPRIYFPIKKGNSKKDFYRGITEGFITLKGGYITQQAVISNTTVKMAGVNVAIGFGIDYYLSKILKLSFQVSYYFPYWIEACSDYSGQHHCSKPEIDGHIVSVTSGIALIF